MFFFHVTHFTFLSVDTIYWYRMTLTCDIGTLEAERGKEREKGAEIYLFICEPEPNANDYFIWQPPESWILKLREWPKEIDSAEERER